MGREGVFYQYHVNSDLACFSELANRVMLMLIIDVDKGWRCAVSMCWYWAPSCKSTIPNGVDVDVVVDVDADADDDEDDVELSVCVGIGPPCWYCLFLLLDPDRLIVASTPSALRNTVEKYIWEIQLRNTAGKYCLFLLLDSDCLIVANT